MRRREAPIARSRPGPEAHRTQEGRAANRPVPLSTTQIANRLAAVQRKSRQDPGLRVQAAEAAPVATPLPNRTGLPDPLKAGVEALSGFSLDDVKVHYDSPKPAQLQALAYTQGADIHLAPGQEQHLPHEAWHVVQQKQGRVSATRQMKGVGINADPGLEREADAMAARCLERTPPAAAAVAQVRAPGSVAQLRPPNPYGDATSEGGGSTAHHIVPDVLLTKVIGYLADDDAKAKVRRQFLPAFGNLTMRQLAEGGDVTIRYGEGEANQRPNVNAGVVRAANADAVYSTTFGKLTEQQKGKAVLDGKTFAAFETEYGKLKLGQATTLSADAAKGLQETFFEWQAGNLMLGPASENRLEPGDKHEFDSDAAYILGDAKHVAELGKIYSMLRELEKKWKAADAQESNQIKQRMKVQIGKWVAEVLGKMATLNASVASVPSFDEASWVVVKNQKRADLLGQLEGKKRPGFKDGVKMPAKLVTALLAKRKGNSTELAALLDQLRLGITKKDAGKLLAGLPMSFVRTGTVTVRLALAGYEDNAVEVADATRGHSIVEAANAAVKAAYDAT